MVDQVSSEIADGVQTIRFDRMESENRLTARMCEATSDALAFGESSSRVRAVLLAGGTGIFCAGHDAEELTSFAESGTFGESVLRLVKTMASIDKPIIAAVDGLSYGLGTTILFHCDYVVASEWAIIAAPFAEIGLPPEGATSLIAPRIMGYHRAFGLLVMGDHLDAQTAMHAGIVNKVVPADAVEAAGMEAARTLASRPPEAVRTARRLMRGERREINQRIDLEATSFSELLRSPAARDALQSYIDTHR